MTGNFINQMEPEFDDHEAKALYEYVRSGGWVTEFKKTEEFEKIIAQFVGAKHCIAVNNGTISLTLSALACGIGVNDEVIVPNYTMVATPNSVKMIGAKPVFVDVEEETLCLDLDLVRQNLTSKTKAIMFVNANGRYPLNNIENIIQFCKKEKLKLIEDSAQALGSFYPSGSHRGTIGDVGSFSFSAPKIISTGQGGAIVTNDDTIASKIKKLKDCGRSGGGNDIHATIGYNFKFTDVQAVIGIEQFKKLDNRIIRKKEIAQGYHELLKNTDNIKMFKHDLNYTTPWFIDGLFEQREKLIDFLKANNIGTRVMYPSISHQEAYKLGGDFPVSKKVADKGLWLPSSSNLTNDQVEFICNKINSFYA